MIWIPVILLATIVGYLKRENLHILYNSRYWAIAAMVSRLADWSRTSLSSPLLSSPLLSSPLLSSPLLSFLFLFLFLFLFTLRLLHVAVWDNTVGLVSIASVANCEFFFRTQLLQSQSALLRTCANLMRVP